MNAKTLAKKWVSKRKPDPINWGKLCGIFQNLLKKYDSDEIFHAIIVFLHYFPKSNIERFCNECQGIIKSERRRRKK